MPSCALLVYATLVYAMLSDAMLALVTLEKGGNDQKMYATVCVRLFFAEAFPSLNT